jgi:outer membrane protein
MKLLRPILAFALLSASPTLFADTLSISAGVGVWQETPSGDFRDTTGTTINVTDELFWKEETQNYFFITFEHPVPIIPNIRLSAVNIDQSGAGTLTKTVTIGGNTYTASENITNSFSLDQKDITLYYEVLDNVVSVDLGLNVKLVDIDYTITGDTTGTTSDSYSTTIPMVYALVGVSPIPDLIVSLEGSFIGYSGSSISDFTARVAYTTKFFVGFEAGYRAQKYTFDEISGYTSNLEFKGPFAGIYAKF